MLSEGCCCLDLGAILYIYKVPYLPYLHSSRQESNHFLLLGLIDDLLHKVGRKVGLLDAKKIKYLNS